MVTPQWVINPHGDWEERDAIREELIGISTNVELNVEKLISEIVSQNIAGKFLSYNTVVNNKKATFTYRRGLILIEIDVKFSKFVL